MIVVDLELNMFEEIISYNNFYEFGIGKDDFVCNVYCLDIIDWLIKVDGLVDNFGDYFFVDLIDGLSVEECIYCFCCVEVWLMVVLWNGIELVDILNCVGV